MITCVFCGAVNEASVTNQPQDIPLLGGPTLRVVVPVYECHVCERMWTDEVGEAIRDHAIKTALGEGNDQY